MWWGAEEETISFLNPHFQWLIAYLGDGVVGRGALKLVDYALEKANTRLASALNNQLSMPACLCGIGCVSTSNALMCVAHAVIMVTILAVIFFEYVLVFMPLSTELNERMSFPFYFPSSSFLPLSLLFVSSLAESRHSKLMFLSIPLEFLLTLPTIVSLLGAFVPFRLIPVCLSDVCVC